MAEGIIVETTIPEAIARLEAMSASVPVAMERTLATAAAEVRDLAVQMMRDNTPRRTGKLADSTTGDIALEPDGATITLSQPAESEADQSGNWGGIHYVQFVVQGRGPVRPVNKKALAGPGFGPVAYAGPAAANPYPTRTMDAAQEPIGAVLMRQGSNLTAEVVSVMRA